MAYASLREANEALAERSRFLHEVFAEAGPEIDLAKVTLIPGDVEAKRAEIARLNRELEAIAAERDRLAELERAARTADEAYRASHLPVPMAPPRGGEQRPRSLGELFVSSDEFRRYRGQRSWPTPANFEVDIRAAVFRTGAGWEPAEVRIPRVELSPQRPLRVLDQVPIVPWEAASVQYMEETTLTNAAAETAESTATTASDLIGEAALALTERNVPVQWIPVFLPVTLQQLEDVEGIQDYIDGRLSYMVQARLDSQILNGNGTAPNLLGTINVSGINTVALGTDTRLDAIYKAFTAIRANGFAEPSVLLAHPNDWQQVRLATSADGIYLLGSPIEPGPVRVFGVPVVTTPAVPEGTMVAGDYAGYAALYMRRNVTVQVSDSHASYFTRGMVAVRADLRAAMVHYRPKAFCTITGM